MITLRLKIHQFLSLISCLVYCFVQMHLVCVILKTKLWWTGVVIIQEHALPIQLVENVSVLAPTLQLTLPLKDVLPELAAI